MEQATISPEEYQKPLPVGIELELLPEREWLRARIFEVEYVYTMFNGEIQMLKDQDGNQKLDRNGEPIKQKQFKITFCLNDYSLSDGNPRRAWLRIGASLGPKAHLPLFLENLGQKFDKAPTPAMIINRLIDLDVKLQLANKKSKDGTKTYQNVVWDAVKCKESPKSPTEEWDE